MPLCTIGDVIAITNRAGRVPHTNERVIGKAAVYRDGVRIGSLKAKIDPDGRVTYSTGCSLVGHGVKFEGRTDDLNGLTRRVRDAVEAAT